MSYELNRQKSSRPRAERDFYPTPPELITAACEKLKNDEDEFLLRWSSPIILDPGCGKGVWGDIGSSLFKFPYSFGIDIEENKEVYQHLNAFILGDFLRFDFKRRFDLIIGNPPYKLAEEFIHQSLSLLHDEGYLFFLLRLAFLEGRSRQLTLYNSFPPKRVYVLIRRPSFFSTKTNSKTTDRSAYAMILWQKGFKGKTELDWLYWEQKK